MSNPTFRIEIAGEDSTSINDRLLAITVTDMAGSVNDSVTISLDDRDELISLPPKGAEIEVWLGYEEKAGAKNPYDGLKLMGKFILDEIKHAGPPEVLTLVGHAFDTGDIFKNQRNGQFHRKTLGEVVQIVAERNGLKPRCHEDLGEIKIPNLMQRAQSDMSLVESLANKVGAIAKVQAGYLYFAPLGKIAEVAEGEILTPEIRIKRSDMSDRELTDQSRSSYAEVEARYYDKDAGETQRVTAEGEANAPSRMEISSDFPNEMEATLVAHAKANKLKQAQYAFSFNTQGNPDLMAEAKLIVEGQRQGLPDTFLVTQAVHSFVDGSGYTTNCACIIYEG